jgi:hypothetical protein
VIARLGSRRGFAARQIAAVDEVLLRQRLDLAVADYRKGARFDRACAATLPLVTPGLRRLQLVAAYANGRVGYGRDLMAALRRLVRDSPALAHAWSWTSTGTRTSTGSRATRWCA